MKRFILFISFVVLSLPIRAASFDCDKASTRIEKAICAETELSELDSQLMKSYKAVLADGRDPDGIRSGQRTWLSKVRNQCQDAGCLKRVYADRIAEFESAGQAVATTQPVASASTSGQFVTGGADASKESEVVASAAPVEAAPTKVEPSTAPVSAPVNAAPENKASANPVIVDRPGFGATDVLSILFGIGMLALVAGMVRPAIASKWISNPTRKKILGIMLMYLVPVAALSHFLKTPERIAYEKSVQEQHESERQAKRQELARQEAENEASRAQARRNSGSGHGQQSRYQMAANRFVSVAASAERSGATERNPSCGSMFMAYQTQYLTDIMPKIVNAKKAYGGDVGNLRAIEDIQAQILEANTANLATVCGT